MRLRHMCVVEKQMCLCVVVCKISESFVLHTTFFFTLCHFPHHRPRFILTTHSQPRNFTWIRLYIFCFFHRSFVPSFLIDILATFTSEWVFSLDKIYILRIQYIQWHSIPTFLCFVFYSVFFSFATTGWHMWRI